MDEPEIQNIPSEDIFSVKNRRERYIELALIFVLGFLLGIAIKNEAVKKITIGFEDYKLNQTTQKYNINQLQENLLNKDYQIESTLKHN